MIRRFEFYLVQNIFYRSGYLFVSKRGKQEEKDIFKEVKTTEDTVFKETLRIPKDIPSTLDYLNVIKITYVFRCFIDYHRFEFPIVIGDYYD